MLREIQINEGENTYLEIPVIGSKTIRKSDDLMKLYNINLIHFNLDKYNIRPDAEIELSKILEVMNLYPQMEIDIRSHTDSRNTSEYNRILSQNRANSTRKWLINHGINKITSATFFSIGFFYFKTNFAAASFHAFKPSEYMTSFA